MSARVEHVVIVTTADSTVAKCRRCGCREDLISEGTPRSMDGFLALTKSFLAAHRDCDGPIIEEPAPKSPWDWLAGDDTGMSSATIWRVMTGHWSGQYDKSFGRLPADGADFGRCHRLLGHFPEWRPRLPEVADRFPAWARLVEHWDEVDALYLAAVKAHAKRTSPRGVTAEERALHDRIKELVS